MPFNKHFAQFGMVVVRMDLHNMLVSGNIQKLSLNTNRIRDISITFILIGPPAGPESHTHRPASSRGMIEVEAVAAVAE